MKALLVSALLALAGCAEVSPVMSTGNNSYLISVVSHSQFSEALVKATTEAGEYCTRQGKHVVVNQTDTAGTQFMSSCSARVQFACYDESDPRYRQAILHDESH